MLRQLRGFTCLWIAVALLAACGQGISGAGGEPTPAPPTPTAAPVEDGRTVLRVGTGDSGEGLKPHQEIIARFEAENPDITVRLEPVGEGDYYAIILQQLADGTAPDILQIGDDAVPSFVDRKAFAPLDEFIASADYPLDTSIYLPGVLEPGQWAGNQYLLPKDFSPLAVYYNKKIFDQFGVAYPEDGWTWQEFRETAEALTRDTDGDGETDIWGVQLPGAWPVSFEYWSAAAGSRLVDPNGAGFIGYMNSPPNVEALRFYADLYHVQKVAPIPADPNPFNPANNEFERGVAAMRIFGRWPQAGLRQNPAIDLGVVGMPAGRKRANVLLWGGFGISAQSQNQEAAWRFLRFYVGEQGAEVWKDWALPTVRSVAEEAGLDKDPIEGVWINELNYLAPRAYLSLPIWTVAGEPALRTMLERVIAEPDLDLFAALDEAADDAQGAMIVQR